MEFIIINHLFSYTPRGKQKRTEKEGFFLDLTEELHHHGKRGSDIGQKKQS